MTLGEFSDLVLRLLMLDSGGTDEDEDNRDYYLLLLLLEYYSVPNLNSPKDDRESLLIP